MSLTDDRKKPKKKLFRRIPENYRADFHNERINDNFGRVYVFSICIIILQVILNIINILKPSDTQQENVTYYIMLSLAMIAGGCVYAVSRVLANKGIIKSIAVKHALSDGFIYLYIIIQLLFCTLNILTGSGVNGYSIAILIVGTVPIVKPSQSLTVISLSFIYIVLVMFLCRDISSTWNDVLMSDSWTNLIIITALTMCISVFIYNMYASNYLSRMALVEANDNLEKTVYERTRELEKQTEVAQAASRAKSDFLANMSHEVRTPLNAIVGMAHIANKSAGTDQEKMRHATAEIVTASSHLLDLLNDILDMSKIESGKFGINNAPFELSAAMNEVVELIRVKCEENGLELMTNCTELPNIYLVGDKLRIKQVLLNLMGNSVKFTKEGGQICFDVFLEHLDDNRVSLRFRVADTGIGMNEEQLDCLFDPFEQTSSEISKDFGGTGLGLSISQSLINLMGGNITAESTPGEGSVFHFTIEAEKAETESNDEIFDESIPDLEGCNILLVEDVAVNRLILSEILLETGVSIDEAEDGVQAVERFIESAEGHYDLIFMDIQMPKLDGYGATRRIRSLERRDSGDVPIVALTANAYQEDVRKAMEAGMDAHLAKPIDVSAVMKLLCEQLSGKTS